MRPVGRFVSRLKWPAVLGILTVALSGCGNYFSSRASVLAPAGPVASRELSLIQISLYIMLVIFVVVMGLWGFALIRYRARRNDTSAVSASTGDTRLEILWTVVPLLIVIYLTVLTVQTEFYLTRRPNPATSLQVSVTGHQFFWQFDYPGLGISTIHNLYIPVGEKVNLTLTSADVIHSFWVPELAGKTDAIPGYHTYMWLEASRAGSYFGECAQFCGVGHYNMHMTVIALPPAQFQTWVKSMQKKGAASGTAWALERGPLPVSS